MKTGTLSVLNCADGDTKISFDSNNPDEVERAKACVEDMLRRGYTIAVVVGGKMERVTGFDRTRDEYIVESRISKPESEATPRPRVESATHESKVRRGVVKARRGVRTNRAVAVGPTAGGGLCCRFFPARIVDIRGGGA